MLDFSLTSDQRQMLETVERIRKDVIEPNAMRWMDGTFPYDNMHVLAEAGVLGMAVPEEYGGSGLSRRRDRRDDGAAVPREQRRP